MKKLGVFVGKTPEDFSVYLVGQQLAKYLGGELYRAEDKFGEYEVTINLVVEKQVQLLNTMRYVGLRKVILLWAPNHEEFDEPDLARVLLRTILPQGKCPYNLVVPSQYTYDGLTKFLKSTFSFPLVNRILEKIKLIWYGVEPFEWVENKSPLKWLAPFNRVDVKQKAIDQHYKIMSQLQLTASLAGKVLENKFVFAYYSGRAISDIQAKYPSYKVVAQGPRSGYLGVLKEAGAFLCTSNYESFGIYYLELLLSGAVGVFEDKPWVKKLLPGYPLIVSKSELASACWDVVNRYDYWSRLVREYVPLIRQRYDFKRMATQYRTLLE